MSSLLVNEKWSANPATVLVFDETSKGTTLESLPPNLACSSLSRIDTSLERISVRKLVVVRRHSLEEKKEVSVLEL